MRGVIQDKWWEKALCLGLDVNMFFPGSGVKAAKALAVCQMCPVRRDCLESALHEETTGGYGHRAGIRGGLLAYQRGKIARRRRQERAA